MKTAHPRGEPLGGRARYVRKAATHPVQLVLLSSLAMAPFYGCGFLALVIVGVAEVVLIGFLPRSVLFRSCVDGQLHAIEVRDAIEVRGRLLVRMTDAHREEFGRLESLVDSVRCRITSNSLSDVTSEDCLGLDRLLATYVDGSITYRGVKTCVAMASPDELQGEIALLSTVIAAAETPEARNLATNRIEVARMRAAQWRRSQHELEVLDGQLALISNLVRLTYEHCAAPARREAFRDEVEIAFARAGGRHETIHQIAEIIEEYGFPDARKLRLGRNMAGVHAAPATALPPGGEGVANSILPISELQPRIADALGGRLAEHNSSKSNPVETSLRDQTWCRDLAMMSVR